MPTNVKVILQAKTRIKLIVISFLCLLSLAVLSPATTAFAQTGNAADYTNINAEQGVPRDMNTLSQSVFINMLDAVACGISGINPASPSTPCLGINAVTGKLGYNTNATGLTGLLSTAIIPLFKQPIHTSDYVAYMQHNFGITKHAYAQTTGTGFNGLAAFIGIWSQFRNIVYLFFVVILALTGLGIMLRLKLDPKAVMTIENQIPKLIIGLLLVTFSYAIAGLMIDLMNVVIYAVVNIFKTVDTNLAPATIFANLNQVPYGFADKAILQDVGGIFGVTNQVANFLAAITANVITQAINSQTVLQVITALFNLQCLLGAFNLTNIFDANTYNQCVTDGINSVVLVIGFLIIYIAIVVALLRLWFALIKAYVFFLINVMLGPFYIALGLVPGSPIGFGYWIREIGGNLAAFPTVMVMFLLAKVFIDAIPAAGGTLFVPPFIGNYIGGNGNQDATQFLGAVIGLGIILMMPSAVKIAQDIFKSKGIGYATAIGESVKGGQTVAAGLAGATLGQAGARGWNTLAMNEGPIHNMIQSRFGPRGVKIAQGIGLIRPRSH